jgi:hypothetical protein
MTDTTTTDFWRSLANGTGDNERDYRVHVATDNHDHPSITVHHLNPDGTETRQPRHRLNLDAAAALALDLAAAIEQADTEPADGNQP